MNVDNMTVALENIDEGEDYLVDDFLLGRQIAAVEDFNFDSLLMTLEGGQAKEDDVVVAGIENSFNVGDKIKRLSATIVEAIRKIIKRIIGLAKYMIEKIMNVFNKQAAKKLKENAAKATYTDDFVFDLSGSVMELASCSPSGFNYKITASLVDLSSMLKSHERVLRSLQKYLKSIKEDGEDWFYLSNNETNRLINGLISQFEQYEKGVNIEPVIRRLDDNDGTGMPLFRCVAKDSLRSYPEGSSFTIPANDAAQQISKVAGNFLVISETMDEINSVAGKLVKEYEDLANTISRNNILGNLSGSDNDSVSRLIKLAGSVTRFNSDISSNIANILDAAKMYTVDSMKLKRALDSYTNANMSVK